MAQLRVLLRIPVVAVRKHQLPADLLRDLFRADFTQVFCTVRLRLPFQGHIC
jgi:hypothetical protein